MDKKWEAFKRKQKAIEFGDKKINKKSKRDKNIIQIREIREIREMQERYINTTQSR